MGKIRIKGKEYTVSDTDEAKMLQIQDIINEIKRLNAK